MSESTSDKDAGFGDEPQVKAAARKKSGGGIASLALLLSIVALGVVAFDYLRDRAAADDYAANEERLNNLIAAADSTRASLASLEQGVSTLTAIDEERAATIARLDRQMLERMQEFESLPARMSSVESMVASFQGISTGARDAWLMAEAEYYMQIGNAQLQLANNPELAMLALEQADQTILQLADPRLTGVRRALSDEIRALEGMETPDVAGISMTLASLSDAIDTLPLQQSAIAAEDDSANAIDPELTGMDRAWASLQQALGRVVKVRDATTGDRPPLPPEAAYFLRANVTLQLQLARLALLRGEDGIFRRSLDDADAWLREYYAMESTSVSNARETIGELRDTVFRGAIPDISTSLRLLRQVGATSSSTDDESETVEDEPQQ